MKKIICIVLTIIMSAAFAVTASAKGAEKKSAGGKFAYFSSDEMKVTVAEKSMTVSETVVVKKNEALVIPQGCKLTLKKGCKLYGTLFVSGGGTLSFTGGKLEIHGSLISESIVAVGKKARLSVVEGGELYVSPRGTFRSSTSDVTLKDGCTVVCLGKNSVSNCAEKNKKAICAKASGGVIVETYGGKIAGSKNISAEETLSVLITAYNINEKIPQNENYEYLVVLIESGNTLTIGTVYEMIADIGKSEIDEVLKLSGQYGVAMSVSEYPQIFHNGKVYFYNGVFSNQKISGGKVVSDDKAIDVEAVRASGKFLGRSTIDYNFKSAPNTELYVTGSDVSFDVYEL